MVECDIFLKDKNHYRFDFRCCCFSFFGERFQRENNRPAVKSSPQKTKVGEAILFL